MDKMQYGVKPDIFKYALTSKLLLHAWWMQTKMPSKSLLLFVDDDDI